MKQVLVLHEYTLMQRVDTADDIEEAEWLSVADVAYLMIRVRMKGTWHAPRLMHSMGVWPIQIPSPDWLDGC